MSNKIVLVTGGTGFTGNYMLKKLCSLDYQVRAIKRPSSDISGLSDLPIKWYEGDVYDTELLETAMQGVQQIYHLAAAYRTTNLPDIELTNVHLTSTKILAKLALKQPSFERLVLVSTIGVLGHVDNPPINEQAPYNPGDLYQSTKADAEKWLISFAADNSLPYSIVRPAAIYGPGDRCLLKFFKMAKLPVIPLIGFTKGLYHMIHVEDLVEFIWFTTTTQKSLSQIYICGNPQANTLKEMLVTIAEHYGKKTRFIRIPASPLFLLARVVDFISKKLEVEPFIYPRRVAFFTKDRSFDTSKMASLEGYKYKYTEEEGLKQLADWYQSQQWL